MTPSGLDAVAYWRTLPLTLALRITAACCIIIALRCPLQQRIECRTQRLSPLGQAVLYFRRHLVMNDAPHDPVLFHLPKLLDQHLLRDLRNRALKIREAQDLTAK